MAKLIHSAILGQALFDSVVAHTEGTIGPTSSGDRRCPYVQRTIVLTRVQNKASKLELQGSTYSARVYTVAKHVLQNLWGILRPSPRSLGGRRPRRRET